MVVVLELGHGQEVIPVILSLIDEEAKVLLQLLVGSLSLSVRLWVVGSGGCDANA